MIFRIYLAITISLLTSGSAFATSEDIRTKAKPRYSNAAVAKSLGNEQTNKLRAKKAGVESEQDHNADIAAVNEKQEAFEQEDTRTFSNEEQTDFKTKQKPAQPVHPGKLHIRDYKGRIAQDEKELENLLKQKVALGKEKAEWPALEKGLNTQKGLLDKEKVNFEKQRADFEKQRADFEKLKANLEMQKGLLDKKKADFEKQQADFEKKKVALEMQKAAHPTLERNLENDIKTRKEALARLKQKAGVK